MAGFVKGDIVVVPLPFSDLSNAKRRPAFVLTDLNGNDIILCQITSQLNKDKYSIEILDSDFQSGSLKKISNIRPNRIFTADKSIILYKIGSLKPAKSLQIIQKIIEILSS